MNTPRKPTVDELIAALEFHLTPRTDPDHCDPCPYNEGEQETPQDTCQYRLMRDCLDTLKAFRNHEDELYLVKDFIEYTLNMDLPNEYSRPNSTFSTAEFAFILGAAFERYKQIWE